MKKTLLLLCSAVLLAVYTHAQVWQPLGPAAGYNTAGVNFTSIAIDKTTNTPYASMLEANGKVTVMQYNGTNWQVVGSAGISVGKAKSPSVAVDNNGVLYAAYIDTLGKLTVLNYTGSAWQQVGTLPNTILVTGMLPLAIDHHNRPYVVYHYNFEKKEYIYRFENNTWNQVGNTFLWNADICTFTGIAFTGDDVPVITYTSDPSGGHGMGPFMMTLVNGIWESSGELWGDSFGHTAAEVVVDSGGSIYTGRNDTYNQGTFGKVTRSGEQVGNFNFPIGRLTLDKTNNLYMTYNDPDVNLRSSVLRFDGANWNYMGAKGFAPGNGRTAVDTNTVLFAISDTSWGYKLTSDANAPAINKPNIETNGYQYLILCPGSKTKVHYTVSGNFNPGNVFTAQFSDQKGSFANPVDIGTLESTGNGIINVEIPEVPENTYDPNYRVRIVSSSPAIVSAVQDTVFGMGPRVIADAGPDRYIGSCDGSGPQEVKIGGSPTAAAGGIGYAWRYEWSPSIGLDTVDAENPTVSGLTNTTTYTLTLRSNLTAGMYCIATDEVTVYSGNDSVASVRISTTDKLCAGYGVFYIAEGVNAGATPTYNWKVNDIIIKSSSDNTYTAALQANDVITCEMLTSSGCAFPASVTSNSLKILPQASPAVTITANQGDTTCGSTVVSFTANSVDGGDSPTYFWNNGYTFQSGTSPVFSFSNIQSGVLNIWCSMVSSAACAPTAQGEVIPVDAPTKKVTILAPTNPTLTIAVDKPGPQCSGTNVKFTATTSTGGSAPVYNWLVNGSSVQNGSSNTYNTSSLVNNDTVKCVLTSNRPCASPLTATSNAIVMNLNTSFTPAVTIGVNIPSACPQTNRRFTANPVAGGNAPTYNWLVNGTSVKNDTNSVFIISTLSNSDSISCIMTSSLGCASPATATSNKIGVTVLPNVTPEVSITTTDSVICTGASVTFTPTPVNGGSSPTYSWKVNNSSITTGATFTRTTLQNNDQVWCVLTSNAACATPTRDTSNRIKMTVNPAVSPVATITATDDTICRGTSATYTATATNAGTAQTYNWLFNGTSLQNTSSPAFTFNTAPVRVTNNKNRYDVQCIMTVSGNCSAQKKDTSNQLSLAILDKPIKPAITGPTNDKCGGDTASFSCTAVPNATVYTWSFTGGGTVVSGQGTNKVVVLMSDTFVIGQLSVTAGNSCVTTTPAIHTVKCAHFKAGGDETTGIDEEGTTGISLNVYPTPNNGNMFIDIQQPEAGAISFTIYNIIGQPVYEYTAAGYASSYRQWVNLNTQPAGVYFLKAKIGDSVITKNLVITR